MVGRDLGGAVGLSCANIRRVMALLAERFFGAPSDRLFVIAATGSNGKTTTASFAQQLLKAAGVGCGLVSTVEIDDGLDVCAARLTTPGAIEMGRLMRQMVENGLRAAALEASSQGLDQERLAGTRVDAAIFTNLSGEHLDYHGDVEAYARAKRRLFEMLDVDGVAIVNGEDAWSERMLEGCIAGRVMRCFVGGAQEEAMEEREGSCWIDEVGRDGEALMIRAAGPWGVIEAKTGLFGKHNLMNLLEALCAAHAQGVSADVMGSAVEGLRLPAGRMERVWIDGVAAEFEVFVDYAHTDDALEKALVAARGRVREGGRLVVVFGCGGERDRTKRARMGAAASRLADRTIVTSDNPRGESAERILDDVMSGIDAGLRAGAVREVNRARAIGLAIEEAGTGDVVLIAGKGHEDYQIVADGSGGTERRHFDDREEARKFLRARFGLGVEEKTRVGLAGGAG